MIDTTSCFLHIIGEIITEPQMALINGKNVYVVELSIERISGTRDTVTAEIPEKLFCSTQEYKNTYAEIEGELRTYRYDDGDKRRLKVYVSAKNITLSDDMTETPVNDIKLTGYVCNKSQIRRTPLGRTVIDFTVAVNRIEGRADYIPCIAWSKNAEHVENLSVGDKVKIEGRIQSREYVKKHDTYTERRTVNELSVSRISGGVM